MEIPESTGFLHRESLDQLEDKFLSSDWIKTTFLDQQKLWNTIWSDRKEKNALKFWPHIDKNIFLKISLGIVPDQNLEVLRFKIFFQCIC